MTTTIEQLARQAGFIIGNSVTTGEPNSPARFAALVREAHTKELLAGVGEPVGSAEVYAGMDEHDVPEYTYVDAYTADQVAAAVLAERAKWQQYLLDNFGLEAK